MKKIIPFLIFTSILTGCSQKSTDGTFRQVSPSDAMTIMKEELDYIILDVRTPEEYESGHIPGAINVANEIIRGKEPVELPDKDQLILVYCRSGNRSKQAAHKLVKMGYTNIVEFGGINQWTGEIVESE